MGAEGWWVGVLGVVVAGGVRAWWRRRRAISSVHWRGRALRAGDPTTWDGAGEGSGLQFGQVRLPRRSGPGHFAYVGSTGSGKTLLQRLLIQSVVPGVGLGHGWRALVYDAKQDVLPLLAGMRPSCRVHLLHPLDARASAWDLAADVTSPSAALQVATLLIPQSNKDTNPFFANAARHLLYGVLLVALARAPGRWTLRQVLLVVRDPELLRQALESEAVTQHLLPYFEHAGTFQNIISTVLTCTAPYETIAASWDRAVEKVSLRAWLEEESVLVLGNDEAHRVAVDTLNRLIFQRLSELILARAGTGAAGVGETWLFLDEVREMGKLEGLGRLLTKSRTAGACVVLGLQDLGGMREVYGPEVAEEILAQCNSKAVLRLNGPQTAQWAARLFGSREVLERARSQNQSRSFRSLGLESGGSRGESVSHGIVKREVVLDSELLGLPETHPSTGLSAFFLSPTVGAYRDRIPGEWLSRHLVPPDPGVPGALPRPESDQYLRPWDAGDAAAWGWGDAGEVAGEDGPPWADAPGAGTSDPEESDPHTTH
ncbi:MAG: type IV secretion system DNA-binding domain-containing protein [Verrucomicrobiales bacterium]|nr:type IV secretion system DNA-binding domain-containing protein [Verrucomicrobiales bacterium]